MLVSVRCPFSNSVKVTVTLNGRPGLRMLSLAIRISSAVGAATAQVIIKHHATSVEINPFMESTLSLKNQTCLRASTTLSWAAR